MSNRLPRQTLILPVCLVTLNGCLVGPNYRHPPTTAPAEWSEGPATLTSQPASAPAPQPEDLIAWWNQFDDPQLNTLVERACLANLNLKVATARVLEARALRDIAIADLWPQANFSGSYAYRGSSLNASANSRSSSGSRSGSSNGAISNIIASAISGTSRTGGTAGSGGGRSSSSSTRIIRDSNLYQLGFDATWEIDLFGGIRREVEAADADVAASQDDYHAVLVTLVAEVARNYVQLREAQQRLIVARENIEAQQNTLELTQERHRAGFTNELDVTQAETQLASTRTTVPLLESTIRQSIHQISVLIARPPGELLEELTSVTGIPGGPPEVPAGLPSELLQRRPDIRSAERQLAAATARVGVAMADLFPRFALTGSAGLQSADISDLLDARSILWSVGPTIRWPIFDAGRIRANIRVQDARVEQALAFYEATVLTAFREVEDALVAWRNGRIHQDTLEQAVTSSQRAVALSDELYRHGLTPFLNVLESQRALYLLQDQLVQSKSALQINLITLYKALGGGWEFPLQDTQALEPSDADFRAHPDGSNTSAEDNTGPKAAPIQ